LPLTKAEMLKDVALTTGVVENVYVAPELEDSSPDTVAGAAILKSLV